MVVLTVRGTSVRDNQLAPAVIVDDWLMNALSGE
jgi:hypothetical protein